MPQIGSMCCIRRMRHRRSMPASRMTAMTVMAPVTSAVAATAAHAAVTHLLLLFGNKLILPGAAECARWTVGITTYLFMPMFSLHVIDDGDPTACLGCCGSKLHRV